MIEKMKSSIPSSQNNPNILQTITLQLAYGNRTMPITLPTANLLGVFEPKPMTETFDEEALVEAAMKNPIGKPRLRELAHQGQKVAIVTSDSTRPCPSARLLPYVINELADAGIPDKDVFIVLALGLHRPMTADEIAEVVPPEIQQRIQVLNHDPADTIHLGVTARGTPVEIFRPLVEADVRICLGNIEFHYYAGYSGGAKAILPGCASRAAVTANHAMLVLPEAAAGRTEGNPVRADLEEAVAMLGVDFILNVIVDGDHHIAGAVAGDATAAHRAGCRLVAERGMVRIPQKADIVVASAGGYPKDINFYQTHKALQNAKHAVKDGGAIILVGECREGIGHKTFESWLLGPMPPKERIAMIQKEFVLGGHIAAAIAAIQERAAVYVVTEIPAETWRPSHLLHYSNAQEALEAASRQLGGTPSVLVLPEAVAVLPVVEGDLAEAPLKDELFKPG